MIEIERKFLVRSQNFKQEAFKKTRLVQGFLSTDKARTVRVRIKGENGYITVKGPSTDDGLSRFEWEKEIPKAEAEQLLKLCASTIIDKIRYEVRLGAHIFEIDEFLGDNEGLIVAEVELNSVDDQFESPQWLGVEVTGDIKYYNSQLSKAPYNTWNS